MNLRRGSTWSPIKHGEDFVGLDRVVDADLQQRARFRIHRRFPKLLGIHFAQAFVTLNGQILFRGREHALKQKRRAWRSLRWCRFRRR